MIFRILNRWLNDKDFYLPMLINFYKCIIASKPALTHFGPFFTYYKYFISGNSTEEIGNLSILNHRIITK